MKVAIAGATGFIGTHLIELLRSDRAFDEVTVTARRPLGLPEKFTVLEGNLNSLPLPPVDVAFCALGTTMAIAGSKEAFYHVDHDLILAYAVNARKAGAKTFVLVSSVGADARSSNFYLKVKGETESSLKKLGFDSLIILRPSMLLGDRRESRLGEMIGKAVLKSLNPMLLGPLSRYRGIHGRTLAKAMLRLGRENLPGVHVLEWDRLRAFF